MEHDKEKVENLDRKINHEYGKKHRGAGNGKGVVTGRDIEVVVWLGRHRLATAEQVARRFELERAKAYRRLRVLAETGMVRYEPGVRAKRVYLATSVGLRAVGLDLAPATVSAASFEHDMAVVDAAIDYEHAGCHVVLSERELRRLGNNYAIDSYQHLRGPRSRGQWPDLVIEGPAPGDRLAIEVELTRKKQERVTDKLRAYQLSSYNRVLYLTPDARAAARINRWIRDLGAGSKISAQSIVASSPVTPQTREQLGAQVRDTNAKLADLRAKLAAANDDVASHLAANARLVTSANNLAAQVQCYLVGGRGERNAILEQWQAALDRSGHAR